MFPFFLYLGAMDISTFTCIYTFYGQKIENCRKLCLPTYDVWKWICDRWPQTNLIPELPGQSRGRCWATKYLGSIPTLHPILGRRHGLANSSMVQIPGQLHVCKILNRVYNLLIHILPEQESQNQVGRNNSRARVQLPEFTGSQASRQSSWYCCLT